MPMVVYDEVGAMWHPKEVARQLRADGNDTDAHWLETQGDTAKQVLLVLAGWCDDFTRIGWPSVKSLAIYTAKSPRQVQRILRRLEDVGALYSWPCDGRQCAGRVSTGGHAGTNHYQIPPLGDEDGARRVHFDRRAAKARARAHLRTKRTELKG